MKYREKQREKLMNRWRHQMSRRLCSSHHRKAENLVVMSYFTDGPVVDGLIEIGNLRLVFLYEEPGRRRFPLVRFAAYSGQLDNGRIMLGGTKNGNLFKDVSATPEMRARDQHLDLRKPQVVDLALRMEAYLHRQKKHVHMPRREEIPLPGLYAGFCVSKARELGLVESVAASTKNGCGGRSLLSSGECFGLKLLPVNEASTQLGEATTVFADLNGWPRLRVVQLSDLQHGLRNDRGSVKFNFYCSRFRGWHRTCSKSRRSSADRRHAA